MIASTALPLPTDDSFKLPEPSDAIQKMPIPGSETNSDAGKPIGMLPPSNSLGDVIDRLQARFLPVERTEMIVTPPPAPVTKASESKPPAAPRALSVTRNQKDQDEWEDMLTDLLSQCYASQTPYGDKAQMMTLRDQMFQLVLADYTIEAIRSAFIQHIRLRSRLPTPHDIAVLIDPSLEPLSQSMYIRICEKIKDGTVYVSPSEREYMRRFEKQELKKIT